MITLNEARDINWSNVCSVVYDHEPLRIGRELIESVEAGRRQFLELIDRGTPCYGVTTGLGRLVNVDLSDTDKADLPKNILRARAAAIGKPFPKPVVRATLLMRLVNFLSGIDGVSGDLCQFIVDRLNDDFTPWVPSLGHGMAADAIANTHCFQTLIGEGFVMDEHGARSYAMDALQRRGVEPFEPGQKEGLALLNGIALAPAYALHAHRSLTRVCELATLVSCVTMEGIGAPKDSIDPALLALGPEPGIGSVVSAMAHHLRGSEIRPYKLQSPVSLRVIPQVHGALVDALEDLARRIDHTFTAFTDNPAMVVDGPQSGRFLSNGAFHNQHLTNQIEHVALALAHVGALSERRLHRLLDPTQTGLNAQLAPRPGLDAGLVVAHKAAIDVVARLRVLAAPVSLLTSETSAGQEDYMSMAVPAIGRLFDMSDLVKVLLAYELVTALVAVDARSSRPGVDVARVRDLVRRHIAPLERDRSPGPDAETALALLDSPGFTDLLRPCNPARL